MAADFFEKTLEEIVFENMEFVQKRGFVQFYKYAQRQFRLPCGKRIDILTWEFEGDLIRARIIELKREVITESTYFQGIGYYADFLASIGGYFKDFDIEVVLVGTNMTENVSNAIHVSNIIRPFSYKYDFDGISFTEYIHTDRKIREILPSFIQDEENAGFVARLKEGESKEEPSRIDAKIEEIGL